MSNLRANFYTENGTDFVEISILGDPCTVIRKVTPREQDQFPKEWASFKGRSQPVEGTPLEELKGIGPKRAQDLRSKGVGTIEELGELSDAAIQKVVGMEAFGIQKKARAFLEEKRK
jgi:ERCC4-type nuclease